MVEPEPYCGLTKPSLVFDQTVYIKVPVSWNLPYTGSTNGISVGPAGDGGANISCIGDITNTVDVTTISDDIKLDNNNYCQPTNVYCTDLTITETITNISCFGEASGAIDITVSGGTIPYTYSWTGPNGFTSTSEDLIGLVAGYNVTATDALGCRGCIYLLH